ncbi:MAG: M28 family peptidase [Clostridia bacterium]|nr:M28 family peptidase [Clostridia bacterium]
MTETTKIIFEKHQIRKTKKQKTAFIEYVQALAAKNGYPCKVEKGTFGARNILVGDCDSAKVLFTAHYDTCARLPFPNFITPKHFLFYLLYQVAAVLLFVFLPTVAVAALIYLGGWVLGIDHATTVQIALFLCDIVLFGCLILLLAGPANKHTANDNTSGVTVLTDLINQLPYDESAKVAFVFFDLEEAGLFGSLGYRSKHRRGTNRQLVVNFDCVSDGEQMLFCVKRKAKAYAPLIETAFTATDTVKPEIATRGVFYPSDQSNFPCGVGVAAMRKSKIGGILYLSRIHTKRDIVYREENIAYLTRGAINLIRTLSK